MSTTPPLEDYAFLSDMESAALVSRNGSVDWLCWPRFDSAACFCALLHDESAGSWLLSPSEPILSSSWRYVDETLILETRFACASGKVAVIDCLAVDESSLPHYRGVGSPEHFFVRVVRGIAGDVSMRMRYQPRFDYGSVTPWLRPRGRVVEAVGGPDALDLCATTGLHIEGTGVHADFSIKPGQEVAFLLSYHRSHKDPPDPDPSSAGELLDRTRSFWSEWSKRCAYDGRWRAEVERSLLTLKALTYAPSGGVVAAPTTSLPEQLGGERNWDYRYCWLRDATFTLDALLDHGYTDAAVQWRDWLLRAVAGDPEDMQIMYGVLGERRLLEYELPLKGYEGSTPVRVGNAAHTQFQLDVYGELMDSFHAARSAGLETPSHAWELEKAIVDHVCARWREPDDGIWEVRSGPEHFVHSKVMAWVAVDRGIKAIEGFGKEGPVDHWRSVRDEIRQDVLDKGVDATLRRFKRSYESNELDASLMMLPFVGFVEATDEVMVNTIEAIEDELMIDGFVHRYRTGEVSDGLPPGEATFLMCSFWLVDCLALLGRQRDAEEMFERLVNTANDLHLFSEQYDAGQGRLVGNFPQAFSHVALLTSVAALNAAGESKSMKRGRQ